MLSCHRLATGISFGQAASSQTCILQLFLLRQQDMIPRPRPAGQQLEPPRLAPRRPSSGPLGQSLSWERRTQLTGRGVSRVTEVSGHVNRVCHSLQPAGELEGVGASTARESLHVGGGGGDGCRKLDHCSSNIHKLNILKLSSSYNFFPLTFPCALEVGKERI